ncbi:hypothetical protein ONZ51_g11427 [Trametes cubensis]|uniref:WD40 repeat-like protein n=1 Tax=Trametes cubensis TaxID=1111947 RepID=A0AAD7X441_9APHY|nr:hypothetical protein ONZ51_g11427 [Trametes cubensis]
MITQSDLQVIGFWAHSYPVECLSTTHGLLASGAHEEVRIWGQRSKEWYQDTELPLPSKTSYNRSLDVIVTSLHWIVQSTGKVQLVVTYLNHGVHIFDAMNWEHIRSVPIPGQIADSSVSADGKLIAISNVISGFDVYSLESDTALSAFGHTVTEYRKIPVLFIHNAAVLVGGNLQGDVHLWDVSSGRKLHSLIHAKGDQIFALAGFYDVEHDIFLIATGILRGSSGASVILWKAEESNNSDEAPQGVRALDVVDASCRYHLPQQATPVGIVKEEKPLANKSDLGLPAPSIRAPSVPRNSVLHITPIRPQQSVDRLKATSSPARITRSASRSSIVTKASISNHNDLPTSGSQRSCAALPVQEDINTSPSEDEGSSTEVRDLGSQLHCLLMTIKLPYLRRSLKPHTAWFGSEGMYKISYPPTLRNQHDVRVGDVFRHKTPNSIQLWLRETTEGGARWRAVRIGLRRSDGRYLSVTEKKYEPSWVCSEWCNKRICALKNEGMLHL